MGDRDTARHVPFFFHQIEIQAARNVAEDHNAAP